MKKNLLFGIIYGVALVSFSAFALLDTFVIEHSYEKVESGSFAIEEDSEYSEDTGKVISTDNLYEDDNIKITLKETRYQNTTVYYADVQVSSIYYLKEAFANDTYGRNITQTTSNIASSKDAILAINGDYYGARTTGYVIRDGVLYRSTGSSSNEDLVIYEDGSFEIVKENAVSAQSLLDKGAWQVLSFGPALIKNGNIAVNTNSEVGQSMTSNPRTAIGIIDELHYVFLVADGRTSESEGLSLYEMAQFMSGLGVKTAYNLDGGGSSTMYFNGEVVNNPTSSGKTIQERSVSDIVYIGY